MVRRVRHVTQGISPQQDRERALRDFRTVYKTLELFFSTAVPSSSRYIIQEYLDAEKVCYLCIFYREAVSTCFVCGKRVKSEKKRNNARETGGDAVGVSVLFLPFVNKLHGALARPSVFRVESAEATQIKYETREPRNGSSWRERRLQELFYAVYGLRVFVFLYFFFFSRETR